MVLYFSMNLVAGEKVYGVGASLNDYFQIYFPIKTENFLIEPSIQYEKSDSDNLNEIVDIYDYSEAERYRLGVGVFKRKETSDNAEIYYGSRIGYSRVKNSSGFTQVNTNAPGTGAGSSVQKGYYLTPTFGYLYEFSEEFSFSIDAGIDYVDYDRTENRVNGGTVVSDGDGNSTTTNTASNLIIRYYY